MRLQHGIEMDCRNFRKFFRSRHATFSAHADLRIFDLNQLLILWSGIQPFAYADAFNKFLTDVFNKVG
jgi:hypothetical protein